MGKFTEKVNKKLSYIVLLIAIVIALFYLYEERRVYKAELAQQRIDFQENIERVSTHIQMDLKKEYTYAVSHLLKNIDVMESFQQRDREKLLQLTTPFYKDLKEFSNNHLRVFHFYLPDATSFLRLHKPSMFGDNNAKTRPIVVATNSDDKVYSGFEVGKFGVFYRVEIPIFYEESRLGMFDIGIDLEAFHQNFDELFPHEKSVFIKKRWLKALKFEKSKKEIQDYYQIYTDPLFNTLDNFSDELIEYNDKMYSIHILKLQNFLGEEIGKIVYAYDVTIFYKSYIERVEKIIIISIFLIFIAFFSMRAVFSYFFKEIDTYQEKLVNANRTLNDKVKVQVESIRKQETLLLEQSKITMLGDLLGKISHHWRQPLNSISLSLDLMEDDIEYDELTKEKMKEYHKLIGTKVHFLSQTINDFIHFFTTDSEKTLFSINEAIQEVKKIAETEIENFNILLDIEKLQGETFGFKKEYSQIILHLISNAKEAILARREEEGDYQGQITISSETIGNELFVTIEDNGIGIIDKNPNKIFEPYYTTKFQGEGIGLTLYAAKMIIEKHMEGRIYAEKKDRGTRIIIVTKER